ncbi:MAG TPA: Stf0 family sulfotransferase [Solirubrobacteraceae bacterium]|jgi:LPS sulfotransferase NodH|nr:Stf0 family sulfotransferase [Solirubrobacteraceae bacterium]
MEYASTMTPMLSYLVCATPRSGSTLLCHELDRTGVAGHPEEYFEALHRSGLPRRPHEYFDPERHANIVERLAYREMPAGAAEPNPLWHPDTYDRYLAWALEQGTTPNGVFGAKLMWGYLGDFAQLLRGIEGMGGRPLPELLGRSFPGLRYIQITRQDKVRQAVSLWKAVQTQAWKREAGEEVTGALEPVFSFRAINYLVRELTAHDASWDAYFLGLGYEPLKLTYEELAADTEGVVRRVLEHLGIPAPETLTAAAPRLSVQADEVSEEWVRRVHEHLAALEAAEPV